MLKVAGEENLLKSEQQKLEGSSYLDLKLVSWNDSSAMEVRDAEAADLLGHDAADSSGGSGVAGDDALASPVSSSSSRSKVLRATARWDSSEHKSKYLNRETPLDAQVYLVVKCNVKFKLYAADWPRHQKTRDL